MLESAQLKLKLRSGRLKPMSKEKLTPMQEKVLVFIRETILEKGYPPTVREIGAELGLKSPATVHTHLAALEEKEYIRRDPSKPRAIEIVDDEFALSRREFSNIPIVGRVAAGAPLLARENISDYFPIPADYLPNDPVFMLVVKGDSMINAGILDGDKVIVRQTNVAKNGDIVVALIEDSATVKTFYKENGHFRLQPENDDYDAIITDDVKILGEVIGVFRMF